MAKTAKSHQSAKAVKKTAATKEPKKPVVIAKSKQPVVAKKVAAAPAKPEVKPAAVIPVAAKPGAKPVVGVEAKKGGPNGMFSRPQMRRGRRPKAMADYKPNSDEEESREEEVDYKGLEYDTGIRVAKPRDENPFSLDRYEDHDEELNFDF